MKDLVIDTNKLISALISPNGRTAEKIIELSSQFRLNACHFLYVEIFAHKNKILKASKLTEPELLELMLGVFNKITFVSEIHITKEDWQMATLLCEEKDPKDIPHIALSLFLKCELWTGDEKLKKHLISKGFADVYEF